MTYTIERLAPGSYEVLIDGCLVAALVQDIEGRDVKWQIELLDEDPTVERPAPFTALKHTFSSRLAALEWLGIHEHRGA